eukprot:6203549-Pleurochrysis_carterae.AAC.2
MHDLAGSGCASSFGATSSRVARGRTWTVWRRTRTTRPTTTRTGTGEPRPGFGCSSRSCVRCSLVSDRPSP